MTTLSCSTISHQGQCYVTLCCAEVPHKYKFACGLKTRVPERMKFHVTPPQGTKGRMSSVSQINDSTLVIR
ncbi:hypothetical protein RB195_000419 [Necator americanus]|uniref:MSP domain-containing protein n=1 Tax=Necator americanus TaxID=51031 RepID=A0ABR1DAD7_NECAM